MNELELKKLWQTTNEKLEKTLAYNRISSNELSQLKVHHFISSMKPIKPKAITRPMTKSAETVGGRPENTCAIE